MTIKFSLSIKKICQLSAAIASLIFSVTNYASEECVSINSALVDEICYLNLGDYRTENDNKQGGFRSSELPPDITDYRIYFHLADPQKFKDANIPDPNYSLHYDHDLQGQTLYLQDNQRHDITFRFEGKAYESESPELVCVIKSIWTRIWIFLKRLWGFFNSGSWQAVWTEIQIEECEWKSTTKTYGDEQHIISIDVPINTAHAADAVRVELDKNHLGDQPKFKITTTYPHAIEATVALSTVADESTESTEIHRERFVLSSENAHYLVPDLLDRDHLSENITTTATVRVEADEKNVNIHNDVINHHRRLQEIQLINSLDAMGSSCQHPTLSAHRTQNAYCLLESSPLSEASNDFYQMMVRPEQQARYSSWDNTGNATLVKTKVPVNYSQQDSPDDPPQANRYHVYDNGIARCNITADLNQRDFPALACHVDGYEHHSLQINYDHRQQDFNAYLVTAKGTKLLSEVELEGLLHHSWQDWIVGNPLDGFPRHSYIFVPDDIADKQIIPEDYSPATLFPDNSQYIPIQQARNATAAIDLVTSLFEGFSASFMLYPTKQNIEDLAVRNIYQMKQNQAVQWRELDRFLTVGHEDEQALSSETLSLGEWRSQLVRQGGECDQRWEDYRNNPHYESYVNDCLDLVNGVYLALLKVAISDYYLQSSVGLESTRHLLSRLGNNFNGLIVYLRLQNVLQAFQNRNAPLPDFLQDELTAYGEYNHQAQSALRDACQENALCKQLIFSVGHYEKLLSNLLEQYHQRTQNLNQQLSPILSGDGLTEFLLALESWEVWGRYQRTLDHGNSQLVVADILDSTYQIGVEENATKPLIISPSDDLYYSTGAYMAGSVSPEVYKDSLIHAFTIPLKLYRDGDGRSYTVDDQTGEWYTLDYDNNRILINPNNLRADEFLIHYDHRENVLHFKNGEYKTAIWMPDYHLHYLHAPRSIDSRYGMIRFATVYEILLYEYFIVQMESRGSEIYIPEGGGGSQAKDGASAMQVIFNNNNGIVSQIEKPKKSFNGAQAYRSTQQLLLELDKERRKPREPDEILCRNLHDLDQRIDLSTGTESEKIRTEKLWVKDSISLNKAYACWTIVVKAPVNFNYLVRRPRNPAQNIRFAVDCDLHNPQTAVVRDEASCQITNVGQKITVFYAAPKTHPNQAPSVSFADMHADDVHITGFLGTAPFSNLPDGKIAISNYSSMFQNAIKLNNVQLHTNQAEDMSSMFAMNISDVSNSTELTGNFSSWFVEGVSNMSFMFAGTSFYTNESRSANSFNQDISDWRLTGAIDLSHMFKHSKFNNGQEALQKGRPLGWGETVRNVERANGMFKHNKSYNQPMNNWKFFRLKDASNMFNGAKFNQNINLWEFADPALMDDNNSGPSLKIMDYMFAYSIFNNGWEGGYNREPFKWWDNIKNVTSAKGLFKGNVVFNQPMGEVEVMDMDHGVMMTEWNFENLLDASEMFYNAQSFNQDLSGWKFHRLQKANKMFFGAKAFNHDLSSWDLSHIQGFDQQANRRDFFRNSPHLENNQSYRPRYNGAPLD